MYQDIYGICREFVQRNKGSRKHYVGKTRGGVGSEYNTAMQRDFDDCVLLGESGMIFIPLLSRGAIWKKEKVICQSVDTENERRRQ